MTREFEASRQYEQIWGAATDADHGPVIPTLEEPYVEGSLRPETTSLSAVIGGQLIRVTNGEAVFMGDDEIVLAKLAALGELTSA